MSKIMRSFMLVSLALGFAMLSSCSHPGGEMDARHSTETATGYATTVPGMADSESVAPISPPGEVEAAESVDKPSPAEDRTEPQIQSGSLTAGSFDDNLYPDVFKKFVSQIMQARQDLPAIDIGQRVLIRVKNAQGAPLGNARVAISSRDTQEQIVSLITGSDGRALFVTGWDKAGTEKFHVQVTTMDGKRVESDCSLESPVWEIVAQTETARLPDKLDLALVVDTTGSMGDELEYLKVESENIAIEVQRRFPEVDIQFALILYRDKGDEYVTSKFNFSGLDEFLRNLVSQRADGGGDYPEAMDKALEDAVELSWRSGNVARVLFLIGDAPPHTEDAMATLEQCNKLRLSGVKIYPLAASGVADEAEYLMRIASFLTLSEYLFLTDDSGIGNPHAEPHLPFYHVEKLSMLMIRMISSELSGNKIAPKPEHILRTCGTPSR